MIEKISLALINESGETLSVKDGDANKPEFYIEIATADLFSEICRLNNNIADDEIKRAEKFYFALNLKNYLKEMKDNAS